MKIKIVLSEILFLIPYAFCIPRIQTCPFRPFNPSRNPKRIVTSGLNYILDCPSEDDSSTLPQVAHGVPGKINNNGAFPRVKVTCNEGYLFSDYTSVREMTYENKQWIGEEDCNEVLCPNITIANALIAEPSPYPYPKVITVICNTGYILDNGTDTYKAECTKCGTWNNTEPCKIEMFGSEARSNTQLWDDRLPDLPYNSTLNVVCSDDYLTSTAEIVYQSFCEAGAVWNDTDDCTYEVASACPETPVYNTMLSGDVIPLSVDGTTLIVNCTSGNQLPTTDVTTMYVTTCNMGVWNDTRSCAICSCQDALDAGLSSGIFKIYPDEDLTEMEVYCDFLYEAGVAWTVIQKREDGTVDFNRNWTEYENGFGDRDGNFWVGLRNMHILTITSVCNLDVEIIRNVEDNPGIAHFRPFKVGHRDDDYPLLEIAGWEAGSPDSAGHGMHGDTGAKFSTFDHNSDNLPCPETYKSGWWFNDCGNANLNGVYKYGIDVSGYHGVYWAEPHHSVFKARMMVQCVVIPE